MKNLIRYQVNTATEAQIFEHFKLCNHDFIPVLSDRVDISAYASKITVKAERFEAWSGEFLVGLVAAYCNNFQDRAAYITSVSVLKNWQGSGIASELVNRCITYIKSQKFERIDLELNTESKQALCLYEKKGFKNIRVHKLTTYMTLYFGRKTNE